MRRQRSAGGTGRLAGQLLPQATPWYPTTVLLAEAVRLRAHAEAIDGGAWPELVADEERARIVRECRARAAALTLAARGLLPS